MDFREEHSPDLLHIGRDATGIKLRSLSDQVCKSQNLGIIIFMLCTTLWSSASDSTVRFIVNWSSCKDIDNFSCPRAIPTRCIHSLNRTIELVLQRSKCVYWHSHTASDISDIIKGPLKKLDSSLGVFLLLTFFYSS